MVAARRWDKRDQRPNGPRAACALLDALREGPPYPELDVVMRAGSGAVVRVRLRLGAADRVPLTLSRRCRGAAVRQ